MYEMLKTAVMAGLGLQERLRESIDELVKKGELSESEGAKLVKDFMKKVEENSHDLEIKIKESVSKVVERMSLPSKADFEKLNKEVKEISERLKRLEESSLK